MVDLQVSGMHVGAVPDERIDRLLEDLAGRGLTYDHAGSTLTNAPDGIHDRIVTLDTAGTLEPARRTLRRWAAHDGIKASIHPPTLRWSSAPPSWWSRRSVRSG